MADLEQKALDFMAQAEKKLKSGSGLFGSFFGGSSKTEEAAELYVKAGNNFKMAKKWPAAGDAFCRAAVVQLKLDSRHEAASQYVEAGNCFKKSNAAEAVDCLVKAIEIYTDMFSGIAMGGIGGSGPPTYVQTLSEISANPLKSVFIYRVRGHGRFSIAAKHHVTIAEIYETETIDMEKSIAHYEQAADYYKGEESNSSANKCLLKVAQYAAQLEQYEKAITIYEQVAMSSMDSQLLRYGAKDHFFRATLCRMCQDLTDAANSLAKYEEMFPILSDSRECKLLKTLMAVCEEENVDGFTDAVRDYDSISRLDQWYTMILLRIKKQIEGDMSLR